jgi:hypothetical protein
LRPAFVVPPSASYGQTGGERSPGARREPTRSAKVAGTHNRGRRSIERIGQCHCGSLRVMATGEPNRVYSCHCKACQRRTGTSFHFGASYPKERVRLDGERKIYEHDADSGYRIRFHFCPTCGSTLFGKGTAILRSVESLWARLTHRPFRRPATRSGRSRCIRGSACRWGWTTTGKPDHRLHEWKKWTCTSKPAALRGVSHRVSRDQFVAEP